MVGMCWVGLTFVCSFDGTPIALPDKVLVPLVIPRCEVISVEFFCRKSASHLSVHVELLLQVSMIPIVQVTPTMINRFFVNVVLDTTYADTTYAEAMGLDQATM